MRIRVLLIFVIFISSLKSQPDDYYYGDYYATFTAPSCDAILEIGQTYTISWRTNVGSENYAAIYYYQPSNVSGKYCDNDDHGYGYSGGTGTLIASTSNTGSYSWTVPSSLSDYSSIFLVITFLNENQTKFTAYLNNLEVSIIDDATPPS
jgi:hypothetical protein